MKSICLHPGTLLMPNLTVLRQCKLSPNLHVSHPKIVRFCRILGGWSAVLNSHLTLINFVIQIYIENHLSQFEYVSLHVFTLSDSQKWRRKLGVLYCIVSIHLYSASCSAHESEALPVRETQR